MTPLFVPSVPLQDLLALAPAILLSMGASLLLVTEVFGSGQTRGHQPVIALATAGFAGAAAFGMIGETARPVLLGFAALDSFSAFVSGTLCVGLFITLLFAPGFLRAREAERGEFYALMLFATAGMSLLALSAELITLFINLEVLSVATYALVSFLRRGPRHAEAGFKYFILGAFSTAVFLYGVALLYGATGTTHLAKLAEAVGPALDHKGPLVYAGVSLMATGLAFKVAAVPFHMWTPDVYEGAPTPVTALMSAGVKTAAFAALVRIFLAVGPGLDPRYTVLLFSGLAALTMAAGNLLALPQRNVKRMLAYSSVAHAGYLLTAVASLFARPGVRTGSELLAVTPLLGNAVAPVRADTLRALLFYLAAYTVTAVGAFGLLGALERHEDEERGTACDLERLAGLAQRKPGWAMAMAAFMLSLAGIPPTAGFFAKVLVFQSAVNAGLVHLAVLGVLASAAGAYYYLRVVVYMFMRPAPDTGISPDHRWATEAAVLLATTGVMALGIAPGLLTGWLTQASALLGGH